MQWKKVLPENKEVAAPAVEYTVFLHSLFASHGIKGQGLQHPEAISAKRRCLVQCSIPTIDLKDSFLEFPFADFQDDYKVLALLFHLKTSQMGRFNEGVFKREFYKKAIQQYL